MDVSDIFYFLLGKGEGGVRGAGRAGGVRFFLSKNARRGSPGGGGGKGLEGVCGEFGNWGGGLNFFFFGAAMSTKILSVVYSQACYSGVQLCNGHLRKSYHNILRELGSYILAIS